MDRVADGTVGTVGTVGTARAVRALLAVALALALAVCVPSPDRAHAAGPAVSLSVSVPATATAGTPFRITVTARDSAGAVATSYRGRVRFTSTDPRSPVLPGAYTFTAADAGRHTFTGVRLFTAGPRTIAAFDTVVGTTKGRSRAIAVAPAKPSRLAVVTPVAVTAGAPFALTVTAKDAYNNVTPQYRGTVSFSVIDPVAFTPTDPFTVLPGPYTFTATDAGSRTFPRVMLPTGGPRVIHALDAASRMTGTSPRIGVVPDRAAYGLGGNGFGQLGDGAPTDGATPRLMRPDTRWRVLAAGGEHTVGIKKDGTLWAWGLSDYGQLGDGIAAPGVFRSEARRVGTRADWAAVSAGPFHTLGLKTNGTLWAWGANHSGQLGDGTTTHRSRPVPVGPERAWASVATGNGSTLAIARDGTLWGWGANHEGQLGDGTLTDHPLPTQVGTASDWVSVAIGERHALAVRADGSLWAWGNNLLGSLGTGGPSTVVRSPVPVAPGTTWRAVAAGAWTSFGIRTDGSLWAWGTNRDGRLGDGTRTGRIVPVPLLPGRTWRAVATFPSELGRAAAIASDGGLWTWQGVPDPGPVPVPTRVGTTTGWVGVTVGSTHTMALSRTMVP